MSGESTNRAGRTNNDSNSPKKNYSEGQSFLFVVGIDKYQQFPTLYNAVKDAKDVIRILTTYFQFDPDNVISLFDEKATSDNIFKELRTLSNRLKEDDNLIIYFSGHGEYDNKLEEGSWIPYDGEAGQSWSFIDFSRVLKYVKAITSRHTFIIADSCYSGSLFASRSTKSTTTPRDFYIPSRYLLTAGRNEVVSDGKPGDNSPFADNLLWHLENNPEGQISASELSDKVKTAVSRNVEQIPRHGSMHGIGDRGGMFYFRKKGFVDNTTYEPIKEDEGEKRSTIPTQVEEPKSSNDHPQAEQPQKKEISSLSALKREMKVALAERDFDQLFEYADKYLKDDKRSFDNFIHQQGRFNGISKRLRKGVIDNDFAERQFNQIAESLLEYIDKLEEDDLKIKIETEENKNKITLDKDDPFWKTLELSENDSLKRQAKTYQEKLNFLLEEESKISDPEVKFTVSKRIEDAIQKLDAIKNKLDE